MKSDQKEKQRWAEDKPKLYNARKAEKYLLRKKMRERSWKCMWTLQCRNLRELILKGAQGPTSEKSRSTLARRDRLQSAPQEKTVVACKREGHELTRKRTPETQNKDHEDHIAKRGFNSMNLFNLVHKPCPVPHAMKILDAKAAVDKEWDTLKNIPAWQNQKQRANSR